MKMNHAAIVGFAAILCMFTAGNCNSKSSILNFLPAILSSSNIEARNTFRLSPHGTQYTGSEELSFLSVDFPELAVEQADVVEVASYKDYKKAVGNIDVVKAFSIRPAEQDIFRKPVSVTVTLDSMPENAMPFYVDNDGHIWPMAIKERDSRKIIFYTQHASDFLLVYQSANLNEIFSTGFDPAIDGFEIKNFGNDLFNKNGNCTGMSLFSVYHFVKNKKQYGGLYNNFTKKIYGIPGWKEQHLIAGYMQNLYRKWIDLENECEEQQGLTCIKRNNINEIANYMRSTGNPAVIFVYGWKTEQNICILKGHALVAFGYDLSRNVLTLYDPNYPAVQYEWTVNTLHPKWVNDLGWDGIVSDFWMIGGSLQEQIADMAYKVYQAEGPNADIMDIATSNIKVTTPSDGLIDYAINGFYIRGSIDKDQIFPPERITFNIYNGRKQFICLSQYYDQWDFSYIYNDIPDKSVTVNVDPATGTFEAVVDYTFLNRMEKLEAVAHVTVGGEEIQLKTNLWKADGTAINFDTNTKKILESNFDQCKETWNCCKARCPVDRCVR